MFEFESPHSKFIPTQLGTGVDVGAPQILQQYLNVPLQPVVLEILQYPSLTHWISLQNPPAPVHVCCGIGDGVGVGFLQT